VHAPLSRPSAARQREGEGDGEGEGEGGGARLAETGMRDADRLVVASLEELGDVLARLGVD